MDALVAGALGGMLLGLISAAHISILLVFHPPRALLKKAGEDGLGNLAMLGTLSVAFTWAFLGIVGGFAFSAIEAAAPTTVQTIPSVAYLALVIVFGALISIPAAVVLRDRLIHLAFQLFLFIGIFGWLIPNLVIAQRG